MSCYRKILASKIHRATVTHADLHYEGSITIPRVLLNASKINSYEHVHVWNITQGTRFETYAIEGFDDSNDICVNGAAAHLAKAGDLIIIANFIDLEESRVFEHKPRIVFVDNQNNLVSVGSEVAGPVTRKTLVND